MKVIILAGGSGLRIKGDTPTPKPLLELSTGDFLLQHQMKWLYYNGVPIRDVIVTLSLEVHDKLMDCLANDLLRFIFWDATFSIEDRKLGTGGAIKKVMRMFPDDKYYIMNVDDLLFTTISKYNPDMLMSIPNGGVANILLGYGRFPFGVVHTVVQVEGELVSEFEQKPIFLRPVFIGHIAATSDLERMLPDEGDFESIILPYLAEKRLLYATYLKGDWLTINTIKDLNEVNEYLRKNI